MNAATQPETEKIVAELPDRISDVIKPFARSHPDHPALVQGNVTWSYSELAAVVADAALILKHYDIRSGDRVMIVSENCVALVIPAKAGIQGSRASAAEPGPPLSRG
jgi:long-chain acyl-CoA synthetase